MNRKSFLALLAGSLGAFCVGIKAGRPKGLSCGPSAAADPGHELTNPSAYTAEYLSSFQSIEVCGIPIYCDPYCPEDTVYALGTRTDEVSCAEPYCLLPESEDFDLPTAMQYVIGDKVRRGQAAKFVITPNKRWMQLAEDVIERKQYGRINLCQS